MKIKVAFFGTQSFAATVLEGLLTDGRFEVALVVTQPDRPVGRKQILTPSPVKILAQKYNLPIEQPENLKNFQFPISNFSISIVAQYGLLIPKNIIETPTHGTINVHTSLLPKYRGASPIQSALISGETKTGVTIMCMDVGMDTGPILTQTEIAIDPDDTYETLDKKMAVVGRDALLKTIPGFIDETIKPQSQDNAEATLCRKLDRESGKVNWAESAETIYNLYRGLTPWPGIWTTWNNLRVKLLSVRPHQKSIAPGHIQTEEKSLYVGCKNSSLEILELQIEGKKAQTASSFIIGYAPNNQNFL